MCISYLLQQLSDSISFVICYKTCGRTLKGEIDFFFFFLSFASVFATYVIFIKLGDAKHRFCLENTMIIMIGYITSQKLGFCRLHTFMYTKFHILLTWLFSRCDDY